MLKLIETINNAVKLITSLVTLAILGGFVFGALWVYHNVAELTGKPIQLPKIQIAAPDIKVPDIKFPDIQLPNISFGEEQKEYDPATGWEVPKGSTGPEWIFDE